MATQSIRKRIVAIIKFGRRPPAKPKPSISTGAPIPGGRIMRPDGEIELERRS